MATHRTLSLFSSYRRSFMVSRWLCLCVTAETERNASSFRPLLELRDFCRESRDDTPSGCLAYVGLRFLIYPQFPKNSSQNVGLSNCNAIHQMAPPRSGDHTAPTGLFINQLLLTCWAVVLRTWWTTSLQEYIYAQNCTK